MAAKSLLKDRLFWLLFILSAVYIIGNIASGSLTTWDEAVYANIARETLQTNHWIVLHHLGKPWLEKPPLYIWLTALSYCIFGVSEFSTRLASSLFGIATVLLLYIFASRSVNRKAGILSALVLLATPHYLHFAKMGMLDVGLTFFILLIIYCFWVGLVDTKYLFWSALFIFPAYLIKGFAAFLALIVIFLYCLLSKRVRILGSKQFLTGAMVSFFLILGWHLIQYFACGREFWDKYFAYHIYQRAAEAIEGHCGGINFYQKAIFNKNIPWSVLMYISFIYLFWQSLKKKNELATLLFCWILAVYVLYSTVSTKLHWYIMPIYPALAFSTGIFLERFLKNKAFSAAVFIILTGMLIQARFSWAFNLDFNPEVKKVAFYARELMLKGNDIYMADVADSELFYADFALILNPETRKTIRIQGKKEGFLITLPNFIKAASSKYDFDYKAIYGADRLKLYKIKFK